MSRGIEAYLVRPDALRAAIGSADAGVVHAAGGVSLRADERAAVVALINSSTQPEQPIRALRALCLVMGGQMLPNDRWMPCNTSYVEAVDAALEAAGIDVYASDLSGGLTFAARSFGVDVGFETRVAGYSTADVHTMRAKFAGWERVAEPFRDAVAQAADWFERACDAGTGLLIIEG